MDRAILEFKHVHMLPQVTLGLGRQRHWFVIDADIHITASLWVDDCSTGGMTDCCDHMIPFDVIDEATMYSHAIHCNCGKTRHRIDGYFELLQGFRT